MAAPPTDNVRKWVIAGPEKSGKSQLLCRLTGDPLNTQYLTTVGVEFGFKRVDYNGVHYLLQILSFLIIFIQL